jgi:iron transport multicopper oxidase
MLTPSNTQFAPPIPNSVIVNEGLGSRVNFTKGKTYRIRIINFAAFGSAMVHFDSHTMTVIANDAAYVQKQEAYQLRLTPAQRYDVLISAIDRDGGNYPFLVSLDVNRDWTNSVGLIWPFNYTGYLVMDPSQPLERLDIVDNWQPLDDSHLKAYNRASASCSYNKLIKLDFKFCLDQNGYPRHASL